jgi:hypothetical protein
VQAGVEAGRGDLVVALGGRGDDRGLRQRKDVLEMGKRPDAVRLGRRLGARRVGVANFSACSRPM